MIVVIQCAASKRPGAGRLISPSGKPVVFVATPLAAPADSVHEYARPDDPCGTGMSWRQELLRYNREAKDNPLGLVPAWQLYQNKTYGQLVDRFGPHRVFILSAGWGLIRSDFLTPYYDITFSQSADRWKRRRKADRYQDFRMLPDEPDDDIRFVGGKDYVPLFCALTDTVKGKRTVFYSSARPPEANGCTLERFRTKTRTNWQYECANALMDRSMPPAVIVLIAGLAGAGKSTVSDWIAADLNLVHLDIDPEGKDGIDACGLRAEWTSFEMGDPRPIAERVGALARHAGAAGAVLSFPSPVVFSREQIAAAETVGIRTVVLFGPAELCLNSFLERENKTGRGLDAERWHKFNDRTYREYGKEEYTAVRVAAFQPDGTRWPRETIVNVLRWRLGFPSTPPSVLVSGG